MGAFNAKWAVAWWYAQNVSPVTETIIETAWRIESVPDGTGDLVTRICAWDVPGHDAPDLAALEAQWDATIEPWWLAWQADQEADYDRWQDRERKALTWLVKEIIILRGVAGLPPRTKAQVQDALKAEP